MQGWPAWDPGTPSWSPSRLVFTSELPQKNSLTLGFPTYFSDRAHPSIFITSGPLWGDCY